MIFILLEVYITLIFIIITGGKWSSVANKVHEFRRQITETNKQKCYKFWSDMQGYNILYRWFWKVTFKHINFSSIVKQVLVTYLNHSHVRFLEPTSTVVIWGITVVTLCRVRTHDLSGLRGTHSNDQWSASLLPWVKIKEYWYLCGITT